MYSARVLLYMPSVPYNLGCLQESGNTQGWAENPHRGCGSPICNLKAQPRDSTDFGIFLPLQASHYYKYKQQFIFPGESKGSQAPPSRPSEGHALLEWMKARVVGGGVELKEGRSGNTSPQDHGKPWRWERRGWVVPRAPWYQGEPEAQENSPRSGLQ